MKSAIEIQRELDEFCPEMSPIVTYREHGMIVRYKWALQYGLDPIHPVEHAKYELLKQLHRHLGELTVLIYKLEQQ